MNILVADQHFREDSAVVSCIEKLGFSIFHASDTSKALSDARENNITMALIFPDPDTNESLALCKALRLIKKKYIYIIVLSENIDKQFMLDAYEAGTDDYITTPVNLNILKARITACKRFFEEISSAPEKSEEMLEHTRNKMEVSVKNRPADLLTANEQLKQEIIERKLAQTLSENKTAELKKSEKHYKDLFNNAGVGIFQADSKNNQWIMLNKKMVEMFGYDSIEEMKKSGPSQLSSDSSEITKCLKKLTAEGELSNYYFQGSRDNKTKIDCLLSAKLMDNGEICEGTFIDVSMWKQTELTLLKAKKDAVAANLAKSNFLANMSHEIRTPLNGIMGMTSLISRTELSEQQAEYINLIKTSSKSLMTLINDILDFAKIESGKLILDQTPVYLPDLMDSVADAFVHIIRTKDIEFIIDIDPDVPNRIAVDALRLRQVLMNLISNAFKFTPRGEIILSVKKKCIVNDNVELLFSVRDTGIGIDTSDLSKLFQVFTQADASTTRKYGGTGLGLSISKKIVQLMSGDIWVESAPDKGSTFFFTVNLYAIPEPVTPEFKVPDTLKKLSVLIVESNPNISAVIKRYIESFGFFVKTVASAKAAIELCITTQKKTFDLFIIDLKLPDYDGNELGKQIKGIETYPTPRIILIHNTDGFQNDPLSPDTEINYFMPKPIKQPHLFSVILEIFGFPQKDLFPVENFIPDSLKKIAILIADDAPVNRHIVTAILKKSGISTTTVTNGKEAVEMVNEHVFDLILMDIQMPVIDGVEATQIIRKKFSREELPIIAVTASLLPEDKKNFLSIGMNDFLPKPFSQSLLIETIQRHLKSEKNSAVNFQQPNNEKINSGTIPDALPGINVKDGLSRIYGNISLYLDFLQEIIKDHHSTTAEIANEIKHKRLDTAKIMAHKISGIAGNCSATSLENAAKDLETALHNKSVNASMVSNLENAFILTGESLNELQQIVMNSSSDEGPDVHDTPQSSSLSRDETISLFKTLELYLKQNNIEAEKCFESIKTTGFIPMNSSVKLETLISGLEYEEALSELLRIKTHLL